MNKKITQTSLITATLDRRSHKILGYTPRLSETQARKEVAARSA